MCIRDRWGARLGRGTWKLSRFILLLGIQFVLIYPILYMVITAFRGRADMEDPSVVWLTRTWTLDNMALLVKTMNYPALLGYTAEISFVSAFLQTFVRGVVGSERDTDRYRNALVLWCGCLLYTSF